MGPNRPPRRLLALCIQVLGLSTILFACTPREPVDSGLPPVGLEFFTPEIVELIPADPAHAEGAVIAVLADGSRFVLDAVVQEDGGALRAAELSVAPLTRPPQDFISLHEWQTPIRHQRDRGTCVIHAVAAAMEAQYARLGLNLDLSEQYGQHLTKMTSLFDFTRDAEHVHTRDGYENQLALGGGGNVYFRLELLEDYGLPHEVLAPYQHSSWIGTQFDYEATNQPGDDPRLDWRERWGEQTQRLVNDFNLERDVITIQIPEERTFAPFPQLALENATHRITGHVRVPSNRLRDPVWYEQQLAAGREVVFSADLCTVLDGDMWTPRDMDPDESSCGSHAMLMIGYDRTDPDRPYFIVKNSWGGSAYVKLSYDYVTSTLDGRVTQAAYITGVSNPNLGGFHPQLFLGRWHIEYDGRRGLLDINRLSQRLDPKRLGGEQDYRLGTFFDANGATYRVNGTVDAHGGIEFLIDFADPNLAYGDLRGQPFSGRLSELDARLMTGSYVADGRERGFYAVKDDYLDGVGAWPYGLASFTGSWDIVSPLVDNQLVIASASASGAFEGHVTHGRGGPTSGSIDTVTHSMVVDIPDLNGLNGTFTGRIHAENLAVISGTYRQGTTATAMVLVRRSAAPGVLVRIDQPQPGSEVSGSSLALQASVIPLQGESVELYTIFWSQELGDGHGVRFGSSRHGETLIAAPVCRDSRIVAAALHAHVPRMGGSYVDVTVLSAEPGPWTPRIVVPASSTTNLNVAFQTSVTLEGEMTRFGCAGVETSGLFRWFDEAGTLLGNASTLTLDRDFLREGDSYVSRLVTLRYPGSDLEATHRIVPCTVSPVANTGIRNCSEQTLTGMLWNRQDEILTAWEARDALEKELIGLYAGIALNVPKQFPHTPQRILDDLLGVMTSLDAFYFKELWELTMNGHKGFEANVIDLQGRAAQEMFSKPALALLLEASSVVLEVSAFYLPVQAGGAGGWDAYLFATEEAKTNANVLAPAEQAVMGFLTGFLDTHDGSFGVGTYDLGFSLGAGAYGALFGALDEITSWGPQP